MKKIATMAFLAGVMTLAQGQAYIPWPDASKGGTVRTTLDAFARLGQQMPEVNRALAENRERLAIVFVPGILGSSLREKNGTLIYGDLSSPGTLVTRLALPEGLIDEQVESGVKAELLPSLGPMDLYGEATGRMRAWADANRIKFLTCGYDWRRDIRAGARDLERCIDAGLKPSHTDLIVVAHSMGGLVSVTWAQKQEKKEYSPSRRLLLLTTLGSPLGGSCEIIRMVQSGYIQPNRDETHSLRPDLKPLTRLKEKLVDAFSNGVSGTLTQGIRPLVLTWPGAIELSPSPPSMVERTSCVGIPPPQDQPPGTSATIYYSADFWSSAAGKQMLKHQTDSNSFAVPGNVSKVLAKAKEFRTSFVVKQLQAPAWVYYSRIWKVPTEAGYRDPYITSPEQWGSTFGDGRVPFESALNYSEPKVFSHRVGLESVHGNLPDDPNFHDDFFGNRLPQAISAYWSVDMMQRAADQPAWLAGFAKLKAVGADVNEVEVALEPQGDRRARTVRLTQALQATAAFNEAICKTRGGCAATYSKAKERIAAAGARDLRAVKIAEYSAAARRLSASGKDFAFAEGNRGLTLATSRSWDAAALSMQRAEASLGNDAEATPSLKDAEEKFRGVLERNLAKSLVESGQCKAAEPYLLASADSSPYSKEALAKPCNDIESGLQYCFDTKDFCRK